ncbi:hypothetical protein E1265_26765, partial [Streptomyces sp. 8K308]|uniref:hypothetical protein n=1 Tax=Streptomyces sp. 8K308 TaxID=2530388 RepID=UPI0010451D73
MSALDPEHVNYHSHLLIVECKDRYGWGVHNGHQSLDAHCQWGAGTSVYGRDDAWTAQYRFDHDTALAIARSAAPHVIVNG